MSDTAGRDWLDELAMQACVVEMGVGKKVALRIPDQQDVFSINKSVEQRRKAMLAGGDETDDEDLALAFVLNLYGRCLQATMPEGDDDLRERTIEDMMTLAWGLNIKEGGKGVGGKLHSLVSSAMDLCGVNVSSDEDEATDTSDAPEIDEAGDRIGELPTGSPGS